MSTAKGSQRQRVCLVSFSNIDRDARVLRQIQYLAEHYDLDVIGQLASPDWRPAESIRLHVVPHPSTSLVSQLRSFPTVTILGRLFPRLYDSYYWRRPWFQIALQRAREARADLYLANDWDALPVCATAAAEQGAALIWDAHEYSPEQFQESCRWRWLYAPVIRHMLRRYAAGAHVVFTTSPLYASRYRSEWSLDPIVLLNAPDPVPLPKSEAPRKQIRTIHHGAVAPARRPELMIQALALSDPRFSLDFMFVEGQTTYVRTLQDLAERIAPGRVRFREPVPPQQIAVELAAYDLALVVMAPTSYSRAACLPNKLFDAIVAGLPVCIGPSPAMAEIVTRFRCGSVAASFEPQAIADTLNAIGDEELQSLRVNAREAAHVLNATVEMPKLLKAVGALLARRRPA